jgi:hypothetical protein
MTKPNVRKGPRLLAMLAWMLIGSYGLYLAAFSLAGQSLLGADVVATSVLLGLILLATLAFTAQVGAVLAGVVLLCILLSNTCTYFFAGFDPHAHGGEGP